MALIFSNSSCAICSQVLDQPYLGTSGCAFPPEHALFKFCDAPLHLACLATWPHREEFARAYHDMELQAHRSGYGRILAVGSTWFAACGPAAPGSTPYFAQVRLRDWPMRLYTRYLDWDDFVAGAYQTSLSGAALARANEVMTEVRELLPSQAALEEARGWE